MALESLLLDASLDLGTLLELLADTEPESNNQQNKDDTEVERDNSKDHYKSASNDIEYK